MARMQAKWVSGRHCVTIRGTFCGRDLRRLEQMCGTVLERELLPLTVRLGRGTRVDEPAKAFLARLAGRGAIVVIE